MSFSCKCKFSTVMYSSIYTSITIVTVSRVSFEQLYNRVADAIVAISVTFWIQSKKRGLIFQKKKLTSNVCSIMPYSTLAAQKCCHITSSNQRNQRRSLERG